MYHCVQVLTERKLVVVVFAIVVASPRFTLVVKTLLVHVEPYISAHTLYLHTCPDTSSSITSCYWDYYTIIPMVGDLELSNLIIASLLLEMG